LQPEQAPPQGLQAPERLGLLSAASQEQPELWWLQVQVRLLQCRQRRRYTRQP